MGEDDACNRTLEEKETCTWEDVDEFTSDHTEFELRREVRVRQTGRGGMQLAGQIEMQGGRGV